MDSKYSHKLIAVKPLRYRSYKHGAGEIFYAKKGDARLLKLMGKAKDAPRDPVAIPAIPEGLRTMVAYQTRHMQAAPPVEDERPALRQQYQAKFGKRAFMGWDAETLKAKLAEPADVAQG